jgi:hypothetical protein
MKKLDINKLIDDVKYLLNNEVDAEGNPLTNETEMLLQKELVRLNAKKFASNLFK